MGMCCFLDCEYSEEIVGELLQGESHPLWLLLTIMMMVLQKIISIAIHLFLINQHV